MKYVYAFKNKQVTSWTDPHCDNVEPKDKARYLHNFCILNPQKALEQGLNTLELHCLGKYDDEKGKFILNEEPEFLADLSQPFEQLRQAKAQEGIIDA